MGNDGQGDFHRRIGPSDQRRLHRPCTRRGKEEGQTVRIAYDPSRPVSIAPVGGGGDPRVDDAFYLALASAGMVGIAVYFALRAFG